MVSCSSRKISASFCHFFRRREENLVLPLRMKKPLEVKHCGLTVMITPTASRNKKNGRVYESYQIADYSSGERKRLTFSDVEEAKKKARQLAEAKATGERHTLHWDAQTHAEVHRAIELSTMVGLRLDDMCQRLIDAMNVLGGDLNLLLPAAHYFRENAVHKVLKPMLVLDAIPHFLADLAIRTGVRRRKTNASGLAQFGKVFGNRNLHEIESLEIEDWTRSKNYAPKTRNDALNLVSQFYKWAKLRHHAVHNPASSDILKRCKVKTGDIMIFSPAEARELLFSIREELRAFTALWLFSGLRKEEIAKLDWAQVEQGLASGSIYLLASQAKTNEARSVPLADNLKQWLVRYRKASGPVLPKRWQGDSEEHRVQRLDDLTGHFTRKLGGWKTNAPRHSFASYFLALHKDPGETVRQMGTSLQKLQQHYWARAQAITAEQAKQWFSILPGETDSGIPGSDTTATQPPQQFPAEQTSVS